MSDRNEFDDLVRRKLQERDFPFKEEHWLRMTDKLDAERPAAAWWRKIWSLPLLVLLIGGAWWIATDQDAPVDEIVIVTDQEDRSISHRNDQEAGMVGHASSSIDTSIPAADRMPETAANHRDTDATLERKEATTSTEQFSSDNAVADREEEPSAERRSPEITASSQLPPQDADAKNSDPPISPSGSMEMEEGEPERTSIEIAANSVYKDEVNETPETSSIEKGKGNAIGTSSPATATVATPIFIDDVFATPLLPIDLLQPADPEANPNSSNFINAPTFVDVRSPLELTLFSGITYTSSSYTGLKTDQWRTSIGREQEYGGGMDLMRMGRNFGIGTGLHYTTYSETLSAEELRRIQLETRSFYFLTPVDTAILVITDSIGQGGEIHYVGETINTTIMVLDQGTETTSNETIQREAREIINRTSYLEIPLLLDAHVTQGPWNIGLRGGPTIGILAGSRVTIPYNTDGYFDMKDDNFRSTVIGYNLRAYFRYRVCAGWSVGVEPMVRGLLVNSLGTDELVRRPTAIGGMISLNYRFK
jgi:hypothetical protein